MEQSTSFYQMAINNMSKRCINSDPNDTNSINAFTMSEVAAIIFCKAKEEILLDIVKASSPIISTNTTPFNYRYVNDEDLIIEHNGVTISMPFAPHTSMQEVIIMYNGITKIIKHLIKDEPLYDLLIELSNAPEDVNIKEAIRLFNLVFNQQCTKFPFI